MFKKAKQVVTPSPEVDLMDRLVESAESEYNAILQRWIEGTSLTSDVERMRICCEQLQINVNEARRDREVLLKAKQLEPEALKGDEAYAKKCAYGESYLKRKTKYDEYSAKELNELSILNGQEVAFSTIWHRALDAQRELKELREKNPRAFGLKPSTPEATPQATPQAPQQATQAPMTVTTVRVVGERK